MDHIPAVMIAITIDPVVDHYYGDCSECGANSGAGLLSLPDARRWVRKHRAEVKAGLHQESHYSSAPAAT